MARTTLADLAAQVAALTATVAALAAAPAPAVSAPAAPVAAAHIGPSGKPDGRIFPCTAPTPCSRSLRSAARAAIHGVDAGGHDPR